MAEACSFPESNCVFDKPEDMDYEECEVLSVCRTEDLSGNPVIISCWKLTKDELEEVNRTGRIWLLVHGRGTPPTKVLGIKPFVQESSDGPD